MGDLHGGLHVAVPERRIERGLDHLFDLSQPPVWIRPEVGANQGQVRHSCDAG